MGNKILSIVIVNYRTPELTIRCIESVYATTKTQFEIIVVDNASGDDSRDRICSSFGDVVWIQNEVNDGFGRANNKGVANAKGQYILLLNSDMVLTDGCIDYCMEQIMGDGMLAAYSCRLVNIDGSMQRNVYYDIASKRKILESSVLFVKLFGIHEISTKEEIKAIMGAFMLMHKEKFEEVRGFDPDFFMYSEEIDLCRRMALKGYVFGCTDAVYAIHKHEGSSTCKLTTYRQRLLSESLMVYKIKGLFGYLLYHFLSFNVFVTNLIISIFVAKYRLSTIMINKAYFMNFGQFITIPLLYSRNLGQGKRMLKVKR